MLIQFLLLYLLDGFNIFTLAAKDVVFVLDRSGSLDTSDVADAIEFIYNVTEWLNIGDNETRISLVSFSSDVREDISLNQYLNKSQLLDAISGLNMVTGGGTYTANALEHVLTSSFSVHNETQATEKAVVVITDGASLNLIETNETSNRLRDAYDLEIFSIGIGDQQDTYELNLIANDPDSYYAMSVQDYVYLCNLVPTLVLKLDLTANATISAGCPTFVPTTTKIKPKEPQPTVAETTTEQSTTYMVTSDIETTTNEQTTLLSTTFFESTTTELPTSTVPTTISETTVFTTDTSTTSIATTTFDQTSRSDTTVITTLHEDTTSQTTVLETTPLTTQADTSTVPTTIEITTLPVTTTTTEVDTTIASTANSEKTTETTEQTTTSKETTGIQTSTVTNDITTTEAVSTAITDLSSSSEMHSTTLTVPGIGSTSLQTASTEENLGQISTIDNDSEGKSTVIGIVLGLLALIALLLLLFCLRKKLRSKKRKHTNIDAYLARQYTRTSLGPPKPLSYREATFIPANDTDSITSSRSNEPIDTNSHSTFKPSKPLSNGVPKFTKGKNITEPINLHTRLTLGPPKPLSYKTAMFKQDNDTVSLTSSRSREPTNLSMFDVYIE